jgi:antirestriction protein
MITQTNTRRIFIGCLCCYNQGQLVGEWVDLNDYSSLEALQEKAQQIVNESGCSGEEYEIQDSDFELPSQHCSLSEAWQMHELLSMAEEQGVDEQLFAEFIEIRYGNRDLNESMLDDFQDSYQGSFDSLEDWAYDFVNDCMLCELEGNSRKFVTQYFNYKSYARDCELSGDIWTIHSGSQVHIFNN